ncbi:hypothetical protein [Pseudomonas sp. CC120222-01a]|uniref:hypothetical protein n=1 Tax=Pseudomonas sp. CC120222-01a TaxID=1378075 RepID=UPI000D95EC50|nr:hypothetical protein [Pseudomonas sp. CC120222-01a]PVZ42590.1 hypothetical protein N430_01203 [Pseudomonas sp. CC120222-01a]
MKATVIVTNGYLTIFRPNVLMRSGGSSIKAKMPSHLSISDATRIGHSFIRSINGNTFISGTTMFSGVRTLFSYLDRSGRALPKTVEETKLFIADSQKCILIGDIHNGCNTESRKNMWECCKSLLRQLMADKLMPTVMMPPAILPRGRLLDDASQLGVLGESIIPLPAPLSASDTWPDIYLGTPSYVDSTDDFLDHIHEKLKHLAHETVTIAEEHWNSKIIKYRALRNKIDSVPPHRAAELLRSLDNKTIDRFTSEINPMTKKGLINILAIMKYMIINHDDVQQITWKTLANSTPRFAFNTYLQVQVTKEIIRFADCELYDNKRMSKALCEILGIPNATDYAAAMIVLITDNPKFNPMSLTQSKLTNKNGKRYLIIGSEHVPTTFSVEKPRSKSRKSSNLSTRSSRIINEILEQSSIVREKLQKAQHPALHSLFIEITNKGINETVGISHEFCDRKYSLWDTLSDRLTAAGVNVQNFSLSAVRNTQGILEWFRTGSVRMMAKKMGNSAKTVLKSYIPPWILRRQYERTARAFQQKMIVLANIDCPWLLAASDFNTIEDLKAFMDSVLFRPHGRDQFTNAMEKSFRNEFPDEFEPFEHLKAKFLCLNLSSVSLAALRLFLDITEKKEETASEVTQSETNSLAIPLNDLNLLARMMQAAVELPATTAAAQAIRSNLQGNSFKELTIAWQQSSELLTKWKLDATHPKLSP